MSDVSSGRAEVASVAGGTAGAALASKWGCAVVDSHDDVKGTDKVRGVNASIMPGVPPVALHPTAIMSAERMAKGGYGI